MSWRFFSGVLARPEVIPWCCLNVFWECLGDLGDLGPPASVRWAFWRYRGFLPEPRVNSRKLSSLPRRFGEIPQTCPRSIHKHRAVSHTCPCAFMISGQFHKAALVSPRGSGHLQESIPALPGTSGPFNKPAPALL